MAKTTARKRQGSPNLKKFTVPGAVMLVFWTLAAILWQSTGEIMALFFFGYIGTSVGVGLGLYAALPKKKKPLGRRLALFLVGTFLIGFAAINGQENMQIEGLFFWPVGRDHPGSRGALPDCQDLWPHPVWQALVRLGLLDGDGARLAAL